MKKYLLILSIPVMYTLSMLCSHDVSAKFINSVSYLAAPGDQCGDHSNPYNATIFDVKFNYGNDCEYGGSNFCSQATEFHCISPGLHCGRKADVNSVSVVAGDCGNSWTYIGGKNTTKYDYFCATIKTDSEDQNVRGIIKRPALFSGKSTVSGGGSSSSTGYVRTDTTASYLEIRNCSYTSGCTATFKHYIKRVFDHTSKKTAYQVARSSNNTGRVANSTNLKSGSAGSDSGTEVSNKSITLYPGMVVCETMNFKISSKDSTSKTTKVCVSATGDVTPEFGGGDIDILVKNNDVTKYQSYQREVYAKPGDALSYKANYNPRAQVAYNSDLVPQKMQVGSTTCSNSGNRKLVSLFNSCGSGGDWDSAFSVTINGVRTIGPVNHNSYALGDTAAKEEIHNEYNEVNAEDVGNSSGRGGVIGHALMNSSSANKRTPKEVTSKMDGNDNVVVVDVSSEDKEAYARVPYNFKTNAEVTTESDHLLYAGEETTIDYQVKLEKKSNSVTTNSSSEEYVTKADNVRRELIIYNQLNTSVPTKEGGVWSAGRSADPCGYFGRSSGNECSRSNDQTGTLYPQDEEWQAQSQSFYVQDLPAGSKVCVAVAVYPANSGSEYNWDDKVNYSNSWRISDSKCYTVAKRPSIQIWGGNIYSKGSIVTNTARTKHNLAGYHEYDAKVHNSRNGGGNFVFGSWTELGLIANGIVTGLTSGASLGYGSVNGDGTLVPNPSNAGLRPFQTNNASNTPIASVGGGRDTSYCKNSPLSIANDNCSSFVGKIGNNASTNKAESDKQAVIDILAYGTNESDNNETYEYHSSSHTLGKIDIDVNGTTKSVRSAKDIIISDNIQYGGQYEKLYDVPKMIIYANNIYIRCNVTRIDALLIAENTINTCVGEDDKTPEHINDPLRSNPLIINGAVVARKLEATRTYGAATGANSIVPAEIINFDPTLYLFGGNTESGDDDNTGRLDVTYQYEMAPRL